MLVMHVRDFQEVSARRQDEKHEKQGFPVD